ncbi:MAG: twin-arginine translocase subunit TatC [Limisphaerales bacterium]
MVNEPDEAQLGPEEEGGPVKSFLEHLEDLRWTLIKSCAAIAVGVLFCLLAGHQVMAVLEWPLERSGRLMTGTNQSVIIRLGTSTLATFKPGTNRLGSLDLGPARNLVLQLVPMRIGTNEVLTLQHATNATETDSAATPVRLLNLGPAGGFFVAFQLALYGGIVLTAPFILYFIAQFVLPALKITEKRYILRGFGVGVGLFSTGVSFCYFVLLPVALRASVQYSNWLGLDANQWRAEEYISFVCKFMLGMGLGFELPVVLLTLVKLGILNYHSLSAMRRYMIVINLVLGAVLTTPEVITQVLMALPLQILYEITVWIAWYWERKEKQREASGSV